MSRKLKWVTDARRAFLIEWWNTDLPKDHILARLVEMEGSEMLRCDGAPFTVRDLSLWVQRVLHFTFTRPHARTLAARGTRDYLLAQRAAGKTLRELSAELGISKQAIQQRCRLPKPRAARQRIVE